MTGLAAFFDLSALGFLRTGTSTRQTKHAISTLKADRQTNHLVEASACICGKIGRLPAQRRRVDS